jgi:hypothetical protein
MKNSEQLTPVAAAATALSTLLCCVPVSFAAAVASSSVGLFVAGHQGWFLAASVLLVVVGAVQLGRTGRTCSKARRRTSAIMLTLSAAIVIAVALFPQVLAGLMADLTG